MTARLAPILALLLTAAAPLAAADPVVRAELGTRALGISDAPLEIDLYDHFNLPVAAFGTLTDTTRPVVQIITPLGTIDVALDQDATPLTVANFYSYIGDGVAEAPGAEIANDYDNTFIQRSDVRPDPTDSSKTIPFVLQGGRYKAIQNLTESSITTSSAIENEGSSDRPNVRGSIAMALGTSVHSATSEWFINLSDNSDQLNTDTVNYTVFGQIVDGGMTVADAIAALPTANLGSGSPFSTLPLRNWTPGTGGAFGDPIKVENLVTTTVRELLTFTAVSSDPDVATVEVTGTNEHARHFLRVKAGTKVGTATITVTATPTDGGAALTSTLTVHTFEITEHPLSQTAAPGGSVTFSVAATGPSALTYQWRRNFTPIAGATANSLTLSSLTEANAGTYDVVLTAGGVSHPSQLAVLKVVEAPVAGRITNMSARSSTRTGEQILILGFVTEGTGTGDFLVRALGPGIHDPEKTLDGLKLANPSLSLYKHGETTALGTNDNWGGTAELKALFSAVVGGDGFADDSLDAALKQNLGTGPHYVHVTGVQSRASIVLAEIFDAQINGTPTLALTNASARTRIGRGHEVLIGGFVIDGDLPRRVLIRGLGPGLSKRAITGPLADPAITVYTQSGAVVASNDDWGRSPQAADLADAEALVGAGDEPVRLDVASRDSALLLTLSPGAYSVHLSRGAGDSGVGLFEIFDISDASGEAN